MSTKKKKHLGSIDNVRKGGKKGGGNAFFFFLMLLVLGIGSYFIWQGLLDYQKSKSLRLNNVKKGPIVILGGGAKERRGYYRPAGAMEYPRNMPKINLKGSWKEMGIEYGKQSAGYIAAAFDGAWSEWEKKGLEDSFLTDSLSKVNGQIESYSPEMADFIRGISMGAAPALNDSKYKNRLNYYDKILFLNCRHLFLENDSWLEKVSGKKIERSLDPQETFPFTSSGTIWAALPDTTSRDFIITGCNVDDTFYPGLYQVVVTAEPDKGYSFVMTASAGCAGSGNGFNSEGLYVGYVGVGGEYQPDRGIDELAFGVPPGIAVTHVLAGESTLQSALKELTTGNEKYRKNTERKTLLQTRAVNFLIARDDKALVLERSARHYFVKGIDSFTDAPPGCIAATNHFTGDSSFDEYGKKTVTSMKKWGRSENNSDIESSLARLGAVYHQFRIYRGRMNFLLGKYEIARLASFFDEKDIERYYLKWRGRRVTARQAGYSIDNRTTIYSRPFRGTVAAHVNAPSKGVIHYTLGPPVDWFGEWDGIRLNRPEKKAETETETEKKKEPPKTVPFKLPDY